ncbi:hypothetical protein BU15DRAFT_66207 [Melanogaster broomeanus]|nr:hypothetical protein BU15DRAFT_66207 [Melanogaster broomeanus]
MDCAHPKLESPTLIGKWYGSCVLILLSFTPRLEAAGLGHTIWAKVINWTTTSVHNTKFVWSGHSFSGFEASNTITLLGHWESSAGIQTSGKSTGLLESWRIARGIGSVIGGVTTESAAGDIGRESRNESVNGPMVGMNTSCTFGVKTCPEEVEVVSRATPAHPARQTLRRHLGQHRTTRGPSGGLGDGPGTAVPGDTEYGGPGRGREVGKQTSNEELVEVA